ncbi:intercellular adhesion molecule 1 isoform X1 [Herpailurus yagouaroundi]|uniref:intercellular adhesion molecule 1 isoform X1 n=2 Tax=Herpailurus yagouaroundi TaxID=1608482 RepID=UPI001AD7B9BA|nr:intercellular adhesion molecule 1 isoform X1 [Puma yagouaroundi]
MALGTARPALPALLALIGALLPGLGGAQTSVHPLEAIIPRGGSVQVNCSTSCDHRPFLGLETQLTKKEVAQGDNWKIFELSGVQEDSTPICFSYCQAQTMVSMSLAVYWFPERVELAPLPRWQPVGENLTLRCQVAGGAPRTNLTVVLLRGEEELSRQPAVGEPAEATVTVLAGRDDHLANFSCRTELDLRSRGLGLFQNSSAPRQLRTFVLPATHPNLVTPSVVEAGTEWPVNCTMDGLFPASEAQVRLELSGRNLHPTVTHNNDSLLATAHDKANMEEEGTQQLSCVVTLGHQSRSWQENVTIYSFLAPNLTLSEPEVSEQTVVTVECEAQAGALVMLSGGVPARLPGPRAQLQLNASAEDNGRIFFCSALLEVAGQVLHKNQTRELRVLYGPRLDKRDCLGNWTWQEGSQQTLTCQAWGNPVPELKCRRKGDNALLPIGDLRPVTREVAGTYLCQARSPRGEVTREVVVNVIYHRNYILTTILVTVAFTIGAAGLAAYFYNRQRKIQKYKLQKAQEAAAMKLNTPATPP